MDLKLRVQLSARHSGFLTQADEAGGLIAWSRRWCVLEGASLLLWNYPREQEDGKSPIYVVDLTACVSRRVELVDRKLCPRPRTLLIETTRRRCPADEDSMVYQCGSKFTIVRFVVASCMCFLFFFSLIDFLILYVIHTGICCRAIRNRI